MRTIAHLVRADVRHFRWAILLWIVLVAADTVLTGVRPGIADTRASANLGVILGLLWFARQLGMLLLVPLIVQAHPAVGTDAFWMTRPIPPLLLAASKTVLIAMLLLVVPVTAQLALMLSVGVPGREAAFVALEGAIGTAAWLTPLAAGAVVTLNLPRFALLAGAALLSVVLWIAIEIIRIRDLDGEYVTELTFAGPQRSVLPPADDPTQFVVFLLLMTLAGLVLFALQYRTRLRRISVAVGVGLVALVVYAVPYWPFPLLQVRSVLPSWVHDPAAVRLRFESPAIAILPPEAPPSDEVPALKRGSARVSVSGLPAGWEPMMQLRSASVTVAGGARLISRARYLQSRTLIDGSSEEPGQVVARQVLGVPHVIMPPTYTPDQSSTVLASPAAEIDPLLPARGTYHGEFVVFLTHWELVSILPIRSGAAFQDGAYRFVVDGTSTSGSQLVVRAREWRATSSFDRKPRITYAFYVRNAPRTLAMAGYESETFGAADIPSFGLPFWISTSHDLGGFYTRAVHVFFPGHYGPGAPVITWDQAWNTDAELLIVRRTEAGTVARTLEIPQVSLTGRTASR